jgi:hypothetical protein
MEDKSSIGATFGITMLSFSWIWMAFTTAIGHWTNTTPWDASENKSFFPFTLTLQDFLLVVRLLGWSSR